MAPRGQPIDEGAVRRPRRNANGVEPHKVTTGPEGAGNVGRTVNPATRLQPTGAALQASLSPTAEPTKGEVDAAGRHGMPVAWPRQRA